MKKRLNLFAFLLVLIFASTSFATVSITTSTIQYNCSGATSSFTYPFKILEDSDLTVIRTNSSGVASTLVLNVDYTVTGAGNSSGGTVVPVSVGACSTGMTLTLERNTALTQDTDFTDGEAFSAEAVEDGLDKTFLKIQEIDRRTSTLEAGTTPVSTPRYYLVVSDYVDLSDAITQIGSSAAKLVVDESQTVSADLTVPTNVQVEIPKGAVITVASGKTLTVSGRIEAGAYQIFTGSGSVVLSGQAYSAWFGDTGDGTTDDKPAIDKAIAALTTNGGTVKILNGTHIVDTASNGISLKSNVTIEGEGWQTIIKRKAGSTAYAFNTDVAQEYSNISIKNLAIDGNKANCTAGGGIIVASTGGIIENVYTYATNTAGIEINRTHATIPAQNYTVRNCYILNPATASGTGQYWGGLGITAGKNIFVHNNIIESTENLMGYGITIEPNSSADTISGVWITDNRIKGGNIQLAGRADSFVYNTFITGNSIDSDGMSNSDPENQNCASLPLTHTYNTIVKNNTFAGENSFRVQGIAFNDAQNFDISHNKFTIYDSSFGTEDAVYFNGSSAATNGTLSDNDFFCPSGTCANGIVLGSATGTVGVKFHNNTFSSNFTAPYNLQQQLLDIGPYKTLYYTGMWNPGTVNNGVIATKVVNTVTGAALGDLVDVTYAGNTVVGGVNIYAKVTATDTVTITLFNQSGGNITFPDAAYHLTVKKQPPINGV